MTLDEAKNILINRGFIEINGDQVFDGNKWRNAITVISKWLEQEPCEDCISRQAVKDIICSGVSIDTDADKEYVCGLIDKLPSVTPKEKTGRWREDANKIDAQFGRHTYICSECGKYAEYFISGTEVWWDRIKPNFCPNCGCRMRGDSNGNE